MTWKPNVRPGILPEGYTPTHPRRTESWWRVIPRHWYKYGWRVEVSDGGEFPIGYGLAFTEFNTLTHVFYPIPFNLIVRVSRELYFWIARGGWWGPYEGADKIQYEVSNRLPMLAGRILDEYSDMRDIWKVDEKMLVRVMRGYRDDPKF